MGTRAAQRKRGQATLYDVCRLSGVSTATVSRVFGGSANVRDQVRQRVLDAAKELAYVPSHAARALAGKRSNTLGAVFPEIASGFYAEVLSGIDRVAAGRGFDVLAAFRGGNRRGREELVQRLVGQGRIDGLLLMQTEMAEPLSPALLQNVPIVMVDRESAGVAGGSVCVDNVGGAESMIDHLVERGYRTIAVIAGPAGTFDSDHRLIGCRRAMIRHGLGVDDRYFLRGDFTIESGSAAVEALLASGLRRPDVVFCLNDLMAIGAMNAFRRAGLSVPEQIGLAGFDNIDASEHLSLTSVASPMRRMGEVAAETLTDVVLNGAEPAHVRLSTILMPRQSTAPRKPT